MTVDRPRRLRAARSEPDPRYSAVRVDNHFFDDSLTPDERAAADQLIELGETCAISICIPHSVKTELNHPNTPLPTRARAGRLPYTLNLGGGDVQRLNRIQAIMQGNAQRGKHHKDAGHLFDADLWQCNYFVTCDVRIHKKQADLRAANVDLWIVRPSDLLRIYRDFVRQDALVGMSGDESSVQG